MPKRVIVVGCGRLGSELAYRLYDKGAAVTVVDRDADEFKRLKGTFRGRYVEGEFLAEDALHQAGIEEADALAAVTDSDAVNAVLGHVARTVHRVANVVVRNYDPEWRPMMEAFGLQTVSPIQWGAERFADLLDPRPLHSVFSAGNGEVQIYELIVPPSCAGCSLAEVTIPGQCLVVALTRAGKATIPRPDCRLEVGDVLHVGATGAGYQALWERLHLS